MNLEKKKTFVSTDVFFKKKKQQKVDQGKKKYKKIHIKKILSCAFNK
jgi:hypothetical protein